MSPSNTLEHDVIRKPLRTFRHRALVRGLMLAGVFVAAMAADAVNDAEAGRWPVTKWCVRAYDGQMDCSYFTFEQCQEAVSATGGDCAINPRFAGYPAGPNQPRRYYR